MKIYDLIIILLAIIMLSGCSTLNEFSVIGDNNEAVSFNGISDVLEKEKYVNVIFIHGMGGYACPDNPICDPNPAIKDIQNNFPYLHRSGEDYFRLEHDEKLIGKLWLHKTKSMDGSKAINYYVLDWSQTVDMKKAILLEDNSQENAKYRLERMNQIKSYLLNNNIADAALYMGDYKEAMQRPIIQALRIISENTKTNRFSNVIVTFSLGSSITFDSIQKMLDSKSTDDRIGAKEFARNTHLFFMLANQLPLIGLSEISSDSVGQKSSVLPSGLQSFVNARAVSVPEPWVIAISDPNDQLSYPILSYMRKLRKNTFVTVYNSVQKTAYWIPGFGKVTDPIYAHTGYGVDKKTMDLLINGYTVPSE
ncbi:MAG: hypothetical protein RPU52_09285 [Candidatus Sedimenticola sp. (ex Thyasira tokunagai)]